MDEYRVMLGHDGIDMEGWTKEISTGECTTFKSLAPATEYHCAVQVSADLVFVSSSGFFQL